MLVGPELTVPSVDGWEKAGLLRTLADPNAKFSASSRVYAEQLAALYTAAPSTRVSGVTSQPLGSSPFQTKVTMASGPRERWQRTASPEHHGGLLTAGL